VEVGVAILCASVPSIKALTSKLPPLPHICGSHTFAHQSAISLPYGFRHVNHTSGSVGLDSMHSRMSLAKMGTVTRCKTLQGGVMKNMRWRARCVKGGDAQAQGDSPPQTVTQPVLFPWPDTTHLFPPCSLLAVPFSPLAFSCRWGWLLTSTTFVFMALQTAPARGFMNFIESYSLTPYQRHN
jgi:hypothetical protein